MAHIPRLIAFAVLALAGVPAIAGYAQTKPPPGFQPMPQAAPFNWGYSKSANEAWLNSTVRTNTALNVGGRSVSIPASMRLAANAPRFAAAALFMSPQLRLLAGMAAWLGVAKLIWDESSKSWKSSGPSSDVVQSDGFSYSFGSSSFSTGQQACDYVKALQSGGNGSTYSYSDGFCIRTDSGGYKTAYTIAKGTSTCPAGNYVTPTGCTAVSPNKPLTKEEFEKELVPEISRPGSPSIMPSTVPNELPAGTPLPVEIPVINPNADPIPQSVPYFVPQGDPVPNPSYNPQAEPSPQNQPYIIPGTRVVPSPTPDEPWRVDVQPVNRPSPTATPLPDSELNPAPQPSPNPSTQPQDQPKSEEQQSLCEKHPEILACAKLDEVKEEPLLKEDISIMIQPLGGWGDQDGVCPAPRTAVIAGRTIELSWAPVCTFVLALRPLVIAMAWLSAITMVIVVARRN